MVKLGLSAALSILLTCCASAPHDFFESAPADGLARIYVYRPHVLQMMLAEYEVSLRGTPVKLVEDEGYFSVEVPAGKTELSSRHTDEKNKVYLTLDAAKGKTYFVKIDPDVEDLTVVGFLGDVLAIGDVIAGEKAGYRLEHGQGSLQDLGKFIQGERAKEGLKAAHPLGYHLLLSMEEQAARREIAQCCSSKKARAVK